jgi:hypothetical protein
LEVKELNTLSAHEWRQFFEYSQRVTRAHEPDEYNSSLTLNEFMKSAKDETNPAKENRLYSYAIFDNNIPVAGFEYATDNVSIGFTFDTVHEIIPSAVVKEMFKVFIKALESLPDNYFVYFYSYEKRKVDAILSTGAIPRREIILTRLNRRDMRSDFYDSTIEKFKLPAGLKLQFVNDFPEDMFGKYTEFFNRIRVDMMKVNPVKREVQPLTVERVRKKLTEHTGEAILHMYFLTNSSNDIAAVCSLYTENDNKKVINHGGGITAVDAKYRGKSIARYLKSLMYKKILAEFPDFDYITTDTYPWNTYMYRINEEFGFKPFKQGAEFHIPKTILTEFLKLETN